MFKEALLRYSWKDGPSQLHVIPDQVAMEGRLVVQPVSFPPVIGDFSFVVKSFALWHFELAYICVPDSAPGWRDTLALRLEGAPSSLNRLTVITSRSNITIGAKARA